MQVLAHNILAQYTNRQLNITADKKRKSSEKMASGYRINRSADDAAHLQISEKMRSQIRGLNQASANIQDGISLCQVADGALQETTEILQRINELTIKSANGTNSQTDRQAIQDEVTELLEELDRISETTDFNETVYPLKGGTEYYEVHLQVDSQLPPPDIPEPAPSPLPVDPVIPPLKDSDYGGSNVTIITSADLQNYPSTQIDGIDHYQLGEGTYQIDSSVTNVIFDLSPGKTCLENTKIKDVGFRCAGDTNLSLKDVEIDNTAPSNIKPTIEFKGTNNSLNCFGDNTISGGGNSDGSISVDTDVHLEINGTDTSTLTLTKSSGIGYSFYDYRGNITINSGQINLDNDSAIQVDTLIVNGGMIDVAKPTADRNWTAVFANTLLEINGGTINSYGSGSLAAVQSQGTLNINGGYVYAYQTRPTGDGYALGCNSDFSTFGSVDININGGTVVATAESKNTIGIGAGNGSVTISGGTVVSTSAGSNPAIKCGHFTDGIDNDPNGKKDSKGDNKYTYPYSASKPVPPNRPSITVTGAASMHKKAPEGLYIQSTNVTNKGVYIPLVDASTSGLGVDSISVLTEQKATDSIDVVSKGLATVSRYRSQFGAYQNRLESAQAIVDNTSENTQDAESVMRDTDMAKEMLEYTRSSLLEQAGQSILAQANQTPQGILSLLQ